MPKTKLRHATQLDSQQARLDAASKLVEGERVIQRQTGKIGKFISINRGFAVIEVWVEFETDSERSVPISCNPLDLELIEKCHEDIQCLAASAGSQDCATERSQKLDSNSNSESPNSSKQIPTAELSLPSISLPSPATTTSEHTALRSDNSISSLEEVPVKEIASPTRMEKGLTTTAQDYGGKCGELSRSSAPSLSCGKTLLPPDVPSQDSSLALSPELLGVLPASGMYASGKLSQPSPRAHLTDDLASSSSHSKKLLPTPMAHSRARVEYSRPGQDKLEQKLRELGVIPPGHVSHPAVREFMMGFPDGWTDINDTDGGQVPNPRQSAPPSVVSQIELQESPHLETPVLPPKQPLHGEDLQQSQQISEIDNFTSGSKYELEVTKTDNVVGDPDFKNAAEVGLSSAPDDALLSPEELQDRHRLELKIERAFVEAGNALKEIRDRRLYRDSYPDDFAGYCRARFDKTHRAVNYLIAAAEIYENLTGTICSREDKYQTGTICSRVLPTKESQVRDLAGLDPDDQRSIWKEAVEINGGKVPTGRIVKGIVQRHQPRVERIKEKNSPVDLFVEGDVVEIKAGITSALRQFDGMWAIVSYVGSYSYTVSIGISKDSQQCKAEELSKVEREYVADIKFVSERIAALVKFDLEPVEYAVLEVLQRSHCFTPTQISLLEWLEQKHFVLGETK